MFVFPSQFSVYLFMSQIFFHSFPEHSVSMILQIRIIIFLQKSIQFFQQVSNSTPIPYYSYKCFNSYTGSPLIVRPLIVRISLQYVFFLFSKFCNSSHSTAISLVFSQYGFAKNMLPFFSTMRGPPVVIFHENQ